MNLSIIIFIIFLGAFFLLALRNPFKGFLVAVFFIILTRSIELPWIGDRLALFDLLVLIWWAAIGLRFAVGHRDLKLPRAFFMPVFIYYFALIAALLSLIVSKDFFTGFQEVLIYAHLALFGVATVGIVNNKERMRSVVKIIIASLVASIVFALWEVVSSTFEIPVLFDSISIYRVSGSFKQTNQLAGYLRTMLPFVWVLLIIVKLPIRYKLFLLVISVSGIYVLLLTSSRTNIISSFLELVLIIVGALLLLASRKNVNFSLATILVSSFLLISAVFIVPQIAPSYWGTFFWRALPFLQGIPQIRTLEQFYTLSTSSDLGRQFITRNFTLGWQAFQDNPLLGIGIGNFANSYEILPGAGLEVHSGYLNLFAERGIVGTFFVILFLALILYYAISNLRSNEDFVWLSLVLLVSFVGSLFSGIYVIFLRRREFWLIVGMIFASRYIFTEVVKEGIRPLRFPAARTQSLLEVDS